MQLRVVRILEKMKNQKKKLCEIIPTEKFHFDKSCVWMNSVGKIEKMKKKKKENSVNHKNILVSDGYSFVH